MDSSKLHNSYNIILPITSETYFLHTGQKLFQIWFTQKRSDQSTKLYPLSDFKVRNDLAIDRAYLDGRFRAVPFIPDDDDLISLKDNNNG